MAESAPPHYAISREDAGQRLDHFLQTKFPAWSRSRIQHWVKEGRAVVSGVPQRASYLLKAGERVEFTPGDLPSLRAYAEDLPLEVLYVDQDVIAVNKPAGMVVHAGAGRSSGTVVNALLHHFNTLSSIGGQERPGIVHRLDRDTSGVLLVARTDFAHRMISAQFASRNVEKVYLALVQGAVAREQGRIESKITRDPIHRTRMTARLGEGRNAITSFRVLERFERNTYLEIHIGTGRTHQIRVHMGSIGHPVAGDTLYGGSGSPCARFFLHAHRLAFTSPSSGQRVAVEAALAPELQAWLSALRESSFSRTNV